MLRFEGGVHGVDLSQREISVRLILFAARLTEFVPKRFDLRVILSVPVIECFDLCADNFPNPGFLCGVGEIQSSQNGLGVLFFSFLFLIGSV